MDMPSYVEALKFLREKASDIDDAALRKTCDFVLENKRFLEAPAAAKKHQAYPGGLVCHTAEVLRIASATALGLPPSRDPYNPRSFENDVLIASVIWHDYGKIWDYDKVPPVEPRDTGFGYTRHRWTIRHLSRSYAEFMAAAGKEDVRDDLQEKVGHCILSHHGRQEWGSPVTPMTVEAFIIHAADTISARFTERENLFERGPEASWKDDPSRLA